MKKLVFLLFFSLSANAATIILSTGPITSNQAVILFTPTVQPCTYVASATVLGSTFTPDTSNLTTVVIGSSIAVQFGTGSSTATLAAGQTYTFKVSCNSGADTGTIIGTTTWPVTGNGYTFTPPYDSSKFGNYAYPTIDWNDQSKIYVDPVTGQGMKRITSPGWLGGSEYGILFSTPIDSKGVWTSTSNANSGTSGTTASCVHTNGTNDCFMYLPIGTLNLNGSNPSSWSPQFTMDNLRIDFFGNGSVSNMVEDGCLSDLSSASVSNCLSPAVDMSTFTNSAGAQGSFPTTNWPDKGDGSGNFWGGWNYTPIIGGISARAGTFSVSGASVTQSGGTSGGGSIFNIDWPPGSLISLQGSNCPNQECTISKVLDSNHLLLTANPGVSSGNWQSSTNGILSWVKSTSPSGTIHFSASHDFAYSRTFVPPAEGYISHCSSNTFTVNFASDGVTAIPPQQGIFCLAIGGNAITGALYVLIPATGETRLITPIYIENATDPSPDQLSNGNNIQVFFGGFDNNISTVIYVQGNTNSGASIFKGVYYSTYNYRSYDHSLYPAITSGYSPGQDTTQPGFLGPAWSDTGLVFTNNMRGSSNLSSDQQIISNDVNYSSTIFTTAGGPLIGANKYFLTNSARGSGESINLIHTFDANSGTINKITNTWQQSPGVWGANHAPIIIGRWQGIIINPIGGASNYVSNSGVTGIGPWVSTPTFMLKNGSFVSNSSMTTTFPADVCPAIPASVQTILNALGTPSPSCVTVQMPQPCSRTPYQGSGHPYENEVYACDQNASWSEIKKIAPGDQMFVADGYPQGPSTSGEMMIAISTSLVSGNNYQITWARGVTHNGPGTAITPDRWVGIMMPPGAMCTNNWTDGCTPGVIFWEDMTTSGSSVTWKLDTNGFAGHSDLSPSAPTPGNYSFCNGNECRYNVPDFITSYNVQLGRPTFNSTTNGNIKLQAYPSLRQLSAPASSQKYLTDINHTNGSNGIGPEVITGMCSVTYSTTPVSGTTSVYKFSSICGTSNYKYSPPVPYAGYHILKDISTPTQGNIITDTSTWSSCYAYVSGECRSGSTAGDYFEQVPNAQLTDSGNSGTQCVNNWYDDNYPCAYTFSPAASNLNQRAIDTDDTSGIKERFLGMGLMGPGREFHFSTFIPEPSGKLGIFASDWAQGQRQDFFSYMLPPDASSDTLSSLRGNFENIASTFVAGAAGDTARIQFGYSEYGSPSNFYCTPRQESCATDSTGSTPFLYSSETQQWAACSSGCTLNVKLVPGKIAWARQQVKHSDTSITSGPLFAVGETVITSQSGGGGGSSTGISFMGSFKLRGTINLK